MSTFPFNTVVFCSFVRFTVTGIVHDFHMLPLKYSPLYYNCLPAEVNHKLKSALAHDTAHLGLEAVLFAVQSLDGNDGQDIIFISLGFDDIFTEDELSNHL